MTFEFLKAAGNDVISTFDVNLMRKEKGRVASFLAHDLLTGPLYKRFSSYSFEPLRYFEFHETDLTSF